MDRWSELYGVDWPLHCSGAFLHSLYVCKSFFIEMYQINLTIKVFFKSDFLISGV